MREEARGEARGESVARGEGAEAYGYERDEPDLYSEQYGSYPRYAPPPSQWRNSHSLCCHAVGATLAF